MNKGKIVIISGPSGSGKTTLSKKLLASKKFKGKLVKSISATTRPKRVGEKDGRDYLFISPKQFLYKRRAGHFIESEKVFDNYYGTPKNQVYKLLRQGKSVLLCIDVKGARTVIRQFPDALRIFIKTPSFKVLKERLSRRATENKKTLQLRLKTARREMLEAKRYDHIVDNNRLNAAYKKLESMICKELGLMKKRRT